ncbi:hypothetical protein [Hoeflea sp.]|uniref:hypothetical protein n=1 Tax=Hoeflea sp. TaxID=1940281 RepID=UPI003B0138F7
MSKGRRSPYSTEEALQMLETGRKGAMKIQAGSQPFKQRYNKAGSVLDAIDDLAKDLTGDPEHFWEKGQD